MIVVQKKKMGRPPRIAPIEDNAYGANMGPATPKPNERLEEVVKEEEVMAKVGTFIVINTSQVQGQRYNLEKIRTYGKNDIDSVTLVWDSGLATKLTMQSQVAADELIAKLDGYCL